MYSGTCLIRNTKGPEKCVGLYRMSENSGFLFNSQKFAQIEQEKKLCRMV